MLCWVTRHMRCGPLGRKVNNCQPMCSVMWYTSHVTMLRTALVSAFRLLGRLQRDVIASAVTAVCLCLQGVVSITIKRLGGGQHHVSRALPAQLDVMEVERSFSSGEGPGG